MTKTAKKRVMSGLKSHKDEPKQSHKEVKIHAHLVGHQHMQTREEEGGQPPPIWDLKTTFLPLIMHWILVVKRPNKDCL